MDLEVGKHIVLGSSKLKDKCVLDHQGKDLSFSLPISNLLSLFSRLPVCQIIGKKNGILTVFLSIIIKMLLIRSVIYSFLKINIQFGNFTAVFISYPFELSCFINELA